MTIITIGPLSHDHINSHLPAAIDDLSVKFNVTMTCIDYPYGYIIHMILILKPE